MDFANYSCIFCGGGLFVDKDLLRCSRCSHEFAIRGGIPILAKKERYWCAIPRQTMRRINNESGSARWVDVFNKHLDDHAADSILDPRRMGFLKVLPDLTGKKALDIGSMWGTISVPLAKYAKEVYSIDATYETLELLNIRIKQENAGNIKAALASAHNLPFEDKFFDLVLLIGVLEWLGASYDFVVLEHYGKKRKFKDFRGADPGLKQREALSEAFRVLRPGGKLLIGIENRFYYKYFFGSPEAHTLVPFLAVLPRRIADIYMRVLRNQRFTEYTYSYPEYGKMLKAAGFNKINFYAAIPSYRELDGIIPLDSEKNIGDYYNNHCVKELTGIRRFIPKLILALRIMRYFVPSFLILAEK